MAYVNTLFQKNFVEYASYVIKERAIPDLLDGLKPVQRRILHSLFEMDDGKFHKVANVVGHCMKYHPHGDASIYSALIVLANKDLFIDQQGNFGNLFTGDPPSAARYIECRCLPLARQALFSPEITRFTESYDSRNREPVNFPAKIPVPLIIGAEGIAVGMATKIMPHNFIEVLQAVKADLNHQPFKLFPDFPTGGLIDVSEYGDGAGKILIRAKLDIKDEKRILIKELPYGLTSESLIASIEGAARKNKIKLAGITDFTTDKAEIEVKLARNIKADEAIDALYAFSDCEISVSLNLLLINDNRPALMSVTEVIKHYSNQLNEIHRQELTLAAQKLRDKIHARLLERIFVEERIYKKIELIKTREGVVKAIIDGFIPFKREIGRPVSREDTEKLLTIPIRRVSLYDINKAKKELKDLADQLKIAQNHLEHLTAYSVAFLDSLIKTFAPSRKRRTTIKTFAKTDIHAASLRNHTLCYDDSAGYLGFEVRGGRGLFPVSDLDKVLIIRKSGAYSVNRAPDRLFVDKGMLYCGLAEKEVLAKEVFSLVYRHRKTGQVYVKRCKIEQFLVNRVYQLLPAGQDWQIMALTTSVKAAVALKYKPKPRVKVLSQLFPLKKIAVKSPKAQGVRLSAKECLTVKVVAGKSPAR